MADKASDGLPYGQVGRALFDPETKEWRFGCLLDKDRLLRPVASTNVISASAAKPTRSPEFFYDTKDSRTRRREKQASDLISAYPELQPASHLLPEFSRVSEAVLKADSQSDDTRSQLIALGEVYDESRRRHVAAIAFPCGPTRGNLRVIEGSRQLQGWERGQSLAVETFRFGGEEAVWEGPGVALRAIAFAQPIERGERFLAVRLHTETLVFRPVLRKHAQPGHSRLDLDLLYSIDIHDTGHTPHADVAFNPWFTGQLAIVDRSGCWSVWESGRKSRDVQKIESGTPIGEHHTQGKPLLDDGWGRVTWCESPSTLCMATRRSLSLIDLDAKDELDPLPVDVNLKGGLGWILDIACFSGLVSYLFVLTSSHIVIYYVRRTSEGQPIARIILQLRHHRSPEDIQLRMRLCLSGGDVVLVLRSALSPVVTQYRFRLGDSSLVQVQPPTVLELPPELQTLQMLDFWIEPVHMPGQDDSAIDAASDRSLCHFYHLSKDLQLTQSMYVSASHTNQDAVVGEPSWMKEKTKPRHNLKATRGGFFTDDDGDETLLRRRPPTSNYVRRRQDQSSTSRKGEDWTISYERVAKKLSQWDAHHLTDVEEAIEEVSTRLQKPVDLTEQPMQSLYDVAGGSVDVKDVDGASARLINLRNVEAEQLIVQEEVDEVDDSSQPQLLKAAPLTSPATQNVLGLEGFDDLRTALSTTAQQWTSSSILPAATTASRANLARQMAADLTLASQVLRIEDRQLAKPAQSQSQSQIWDLPVRPPRVEEWSQDAKISSYPPSSRAQTPTLPTPSASVPGSTITGSSYQSAAAAPAVARLSRYTTFNKPPPPGLPRALNRVLSHWPLGVDPAEYDWQHTSRHLSRRDEEEAAAEGEGMTEKERQQMLRRTERHLRRQRREAEESQRQQWLSSQAPKIVSASQPAQDRSFGRRVGAESQGSVAGAAAPAMMGSSQSFGPGPMAASQVVPGRHGGRPPARKKRKSGF